MWHQKQRIISWQPAIDLWLVLRSLIDQTYICKSVIWSNSICWIITIGFYMLRVCLYVCECMCVLCLCNVPWRISCLSKSYFTFLSIFFHFFFSTVRFSQFPPGFLYLTWPTSRGKDIIHWIFTRNLWHLYTLVNTTNSEVPLNPD